MHGKDIAQVASRLCKSGTMQNMCQQDCISSYLALQKCHSQKLFSTGLCTAKIRCIFVGPKQVLDCDTFTDPERYFCSIFAVHMILGVLCQSCEKMFCIVPLLQSHKATCAVAWPCATLLKQVLDSDTFTDPERYFCSIFAVRMILGVLCQSC